jgi:DNA-binding IscR family transcriptional regulator
MTLAVMIELIRHTGDKNIPVPVKTIADELDISQSSAEKMMFLLRDAQLIKAVRGATGGYFPAKDPNNIPVAAVFEAYYGRPESSVGAPNEDHQADDFRDRLEVLGHQVLAKVTVADVMSGNLDRLFVI